MEENQEFTASTEQEKASNEQAVSQEVPQVTEESLSTVDEQVLEPTIFTPDSEPLAAEAVPEKTEITVNKPVEIPDTPAEPEPIKPKWNWGAFTFPMFFGIANRSYLGLLILLAAVPMIGWIFGIVWMIVFGLYGEKWTLENPDNRYRDNEEFRKVMDGWNRAGLVGFIIGAAAIVLLIILFAVLMGVIINDWNQVHQVQNFNQNFNY